MSKEYQKKYKKSYKQNNKIVTFPLSNVFYEELRRRSIYYDLTTNSYAKYLVSDYLNKDTPKLISKDKAEFIAEYIRISRGIANNINQLAFQSNLGQNINKEVLINSLQHYESEFKKFLLNL